MQIPKSFLKNLLQFFTYCIEDNFCTLFELGHTEPLILSCQCPHTDNFFLSLSLVQSVQDYVPKHGESCGPTSIRPSAPFVHDLHNKHSMDAQITDWMGGSDAPGRR